MIEAKQLSKRYGPLEAVKDLTLTVEKGEILTLLGPNGAGKTTTLKMLTGSIKPSSGQVLLNRIDMAENPEHAKRMLGYLPESAPLLDGMYAFDYLWHRGEMKGLDRSEILQEVERVSCLCHIESVMHQTVKSLSKGYRQRVGLAAALTGDPGILILDEPTSGLDPNQIMEFRKLLRELGRDKTVVLSTHILREAEAVSDRIAIINRGRIVAEGTYDQLTGQNNREQLVKLELAGAGPGEYRNGLCNLEGILDLQLAAGKGPEGHCLISVKSRKDIRRELYSLIKKKKWLLLGMTKQQKSLEDVFREATGGELYEN